MVKVAGKRQFGFLFISIILFNSIIEIPLNAIFEY